MGCAAKKQIEPGLYLRGTVDYDAIDAVNFSTLKHMAKSPLMYRHVLESGVIESAAMFKGTAAHVAALEPHRFVKEFVVYEGEKNRSSNEWKDMVRDSPGKKVIKLAEFNEAMLIRDAIRSHPIAGKYLRKGAAEATLHWVDSETGVALKGRPDFLTDDDYVVDLKTSGSVDAWKFGQVAHRMNHHVQACMYFDGYLDVIKREPRGSVLIVVEQKPPYDVCVYTVGEEERGIGRDTYRRWLAKLTDCEKANVWPGYGHVGEMALRLPRYAMGDESNLEDLGLDFE